MRVMRSAEVRMRPAGRSARASGEKRTMISADSMIALSGVRRSWPRMLTNMSLSCTARSSSR